MPIGSLKWFRKVVSRRKIVIFVHIYNKVYEDDCFRKQAEEHG